MQEKTAINRFGDVILWFGTSILVVCGVISIVSTARYITGNGGGYAPEQEVALGSLVTGVLSWLVLASIAYIFNGRSPVAVIMGLFRGH